MKKILSLVVFVALLVWTWNVIHMSPAIGFETHTAIQEKVMELITQTLKTKRPNAEQLDIIRLWTENLEDSKVKAVFTYKFQEKIMGEDPSATATNLEGELKKEDHTEQTIEGEAILLRQPSADPAVDNWKLLEVKTTGDSVIYRDGSTITPDEPSK